MITRNRDFLSSVVWGAVAAAFTWGGLRLGVGSLHRPGPGFIPVMIGVLLFLLSAALLLITLWQGKSERAQLVLWKQKGSWGKILSSFLTLLFYLILLNPLGYLITTFLFLTFLIRFVSGKGWGLALGIAVLTSAATYLLFAVALEVRLPQGIIQLN
jgi:putative tricarboxylic transport membrane protein